MREKIRNGFMGKGKGYLTWFLQANPLLPLTEWGAIQLECLLFIFQGCSLQLHGPLSEGPTWKEVPKEVMEKWLEHFRWRILESQLLGTWGRTQKGLLCRLRRTQAFWS